MCVLRFAFTFRADDDAQLSQDLEEERCEFVRSLFWDYANAVSALCVVDDEQCERIRRSLENCETKSDVRQFVRENRTGNEILGASSSSALQTGADVTQQRHPSTSTTPKANRTHHNPRSPSPTSLARRLNARTSRNRRRFPSSPAASRANLPSPKRRRSARLPFKRRLRTEPTPNAAGRSPTLSEPTPSQRLRLKQLDPLPSRRRVRLRKNTHLVAHRRLLWRKV